MGSNWENWNKQKKPDYHPNFKKRALHRKRRVNYTCEHCGARQGEERLNRRGRTYSVEVAAAHVNHDPGNSRAKLIILCQVCHLRYDRYDHADKARRTYYRKQREAMIQAGQLELFAKAKGRRRSK